MRVKFNCMRPDKAGSWHPGRAVHRARLAPMVDDSAEAREYFAEPPAGAIELNGLAAEHFKVGRTYPVFFEELTAEPRQVH